MVLAERSGGDNKNNCSGGVRRSRAPSPNSINNNNNNNGNFSDDSNNSDDSDHGELEVDCSDQILLCLSELSH